MVVDLTNHRGEDDEPNQTTDLNSQTTLISDLAEAICEQKGIDPLKSEFCLYNHLDTDALGDLVESISSDLHLQFVIEDVVVCIEKPNSDTIEIYVNDSQQ